MKCITWLVDHNIFIDPWHVRGQYRPPLTVAEDENGNVYIRGLSRYRVADEDHALSLMFEVLTISALSSNCTFTNFHFADFKILLLVLQYIILNFQGETNRAVVGASYGLSSRSHAIFTVYLDVLFWSSLSKFWLKVWKIEWYSEILGVACKLYCRLARRYIRTLAWATRSWRS